MQATFALLGAWQEHILGTLAGSVSPQVRATLSGAAYPAQGTDFRGCSTPPPGTPSYCDIRLGPGPGVLQLVVSPVRGGWAVTYATVSAP